MFKWFRKKDSYTPRVNDIVYVPGCPERYLVVRVPRSKIDVAIMDRSGEIEYVGIHTVEKSQTSIGFLSGAQQDKYYGRSPEEILERKINERLAPLVSATELEHYKKVATIRDLIIKDLK